MLIAEELLGVLKDSGWLREALAIEALLVEYRGAREAEEGSSLFTQQAQADELDFVIDRMVEALFGGVHQRFWAQQSLARLSSSAMDQRAESFSFRFSEGSGFENREETARLSYEADNYEERLMYLINMARNSP